MWFVRLRNNPNVKKPVDVENTYTLGGYRYCEGAVTISI